MAVASAQVKELCWAEGRLAVGYPYSIISLVQTSQVGGGGYFGVKRIGMTVGNPRKLP